MVCYLWNNEGSNIYDKRVYFAMYFHLSLVFNTLVSSGKVFAISYDRKEFIFKIKDKFRNPLNFKGIFSAIKNVN